MIFQRILKGIAGVDEALAERQLNGGGGIVCNWWREVNPLPSDQVPARLTIDNILRHLNGYDDLDPSTGCRFGERTPFISTTAGTVERHAGVARNVTFSAFTTALAFATRSFTVRGAVYYGYVAILGRQAVGLQEFAEDTRDLHQWTDFQPYHPEGEILAKIAIPAPHLERAEGFDGPAALKQLDQGRFPQPDWTVANTTHFVPPENVCNIRDVL